MKSKQTTFLKVVFADWRALTRPQKWLFVLYALILVPYTLNFIRAIENRIGLSFFMPVSDFFLITTAVIGGISIFINKIHFSDILFLITIALVYCLSMLFNANTYKFSTDNALNFFGICLPMFIVGLTIDKKQPISLFVILAYWTLFLYIVYLTVLGMGVDENGKEVTDAMGESYALLPFTCLLIYNALARSGIIHWIIAAIGIFVNLSLGTRGPIICIAFFVAFYIIFIMQYKYNVLIKSLVGFAAFIIYKFSGVIALGLGLISGQLGLSTRVFDSLVDGRMTNISESSYRDVIWTNVLRTLKDNDVFLDFNLYVDRLYNGFSIQYVHNLELELFCDFGFIGGGLLIIMLFGYVLKAFKGVWGTEAAILLLVFFTSSIMQLQFSNSFLMCSVFWLFLGMCATMIRDSKAGADKRETQLHALSFT